ncbi:hypothetical protein EDE12_102224 [Methylosinus sp. sav-2]|uniref:DUF2059 domain-containing protein n=1 Tax=Methylosinus sp. sav-2 TaxID=2485168 RepID=UPI00047ED673|nr:hypothetical protein [Methylosinus sp. sav-2]TDX65736.1 hypothetical protein EDE12_102224 [Methylosinus sp. sav-2]
MRKSLAVAALLTNLLCGATAVRADASLEDVRVARQVVDALHLSDQMAAILPQLVDAVGRGLTAHYPQHAQEISEIMPRLKVKAAARIDEFMSLMATALAPKLSSMELRELRSFATGPRDVAARNDFARSSTGIRFFSLREEFKREMRERGEQWGAKIGREVDEEFKAELKSRGVHL